MYGESSLQSSSGWRHGTRTPCACVVRQYVDGEAAHGQQWTRDWLRLRKAVGEEEIPLPRFSFTSDLESEFQGDPAGVSGNTSTLTTEYTRRGTVKSVGKYRRADVHPDAESKKELAIVVLPLPEWAIEIADLLNEIALMRPRTIRDTDRLNEKRRTLRERQGRVIGELEAAKKSGDKIEPMRATRPPIVRRRPSL